MAQSSTSRTSPRMHLKVFESDLPESPHYVDIGRESKETIMHRELEEAKARASQMEKTMRWWSDCTTNWREKWCEVRDERNNAKKEAKFLKAKLETTMKDLNIHKNENQELETENAQLRKKIEKILGLLSDGDTKMGDLLNVLSDKDYIKHSIPSKDSMDHEKCHSEKHQSLLKSEVEIVTDVSNKQHSQIRLINEEILMQKILILNLKLEEANKTVIIEREEKSSLHLGIEKLRNEIIQLKVRCEELQDIRANEMKKLLEIKFYFDGELSPTQSDLINDGNNREGRDCHFAELQIERFQADEWDERERLETEKILFERENKQLTNELHGQDRVESRGSHPISNYNIDSKQVYLELIEKNKEISDFKYSLSKLQKILIEKTTELSHAIGRSEQYETEVKRIKVKVEELKKELTITQDELNAVKTTAQRLQKTNDYLNEQFEFRHVQSEQNTSRQLNGRGYGRRGSIRNRMVELLQID